MSVNLSPRYYKWQINITNLLYNDYFVEIIIHRQAKLGFTCMLVKSYKFPPAVPEIGENWKNKNWMKVRTLQP